MYTRLYIIIIVVVSIQYVVVSFIFVAVATSTLLVSLWGEPERVASIGV